MFQTFKFSRVSNAVVGNLCAAKKISKNPEPYAVCGSIPAHTPWCAAKQKNVAPPTGLTSYQGTFVCCNDITYKNSLGPKI